MVKYMELSAEDMTDPAIEMLYALNMPLLSNTNAFKAKAFTP